MQKNNAFFTFDYELFLGSDSGTIQDCLVSQTKRILKLFEIYHSVGLFFIDASYLLKLEKSHDSDYELFVDLIKSIVLNGHDIGLHLHPHWLDAKKMDNGHWDLSDYSHYTLHSLSEPDLGAYIDQCFFALDKLVKSVKPNYEIKSFRAGGWCVTPFGRLKEHFKRINIRYDFSVQAGINLNHGDIHNFDFSKAPLNQCYWKFEEDVNFPDEKGTFVEIPVTRYRINPVYFLINKYYFAKENAAVSYGKSASYSTGWEKISKVLKGVKFASFDDISIKLSSFMFRKIEKHPLVSFVGHPKNFSENNFQILELLLKRQKSISVEDFEKAYLNKNS